MSRLAWLGRARTLEAMLALAWYRILIRFVPLHRWSDPLLDDTAAPTPPAALLRTCEAALGRAADRLPGETLCLPQALAMRRLVRRRGYDLRLVIGLGARSKGSNAADLHAWLESEDGPAFGYRSADDRPLFR